MERETAFAGKYRPSSSPTLISFAEGNHTEFFIALLPVFITLSMFASALLDFPSYLWLTYHLIVLEALWICQLVTDQVTDNVFHFLFVASIYCGLGILVCWRCLFRHLRQPV